MKKIAKEKCSICSKLNDYMIIDEWTGGTILGDEKKRPSEFPKEESQLISLSRTYSSDGIIKQCPECKTYYRWTAEDDNEVGMTEHIRELTRISAEEGNTCLENEKKRIKNFALRMKRKHKKTIETLSEDEKKPLFYFLNNPPSGMYGHLYPGELKDENVL